MNVTLFYCDGAEPPKETVDLGFGEWRAMFASASWRDRPVSHLRVRCADGSDAAPIRLRGPDGA